jgi:peptidoglycan/xylan/chitin deacetylase (PgdA/CDA1 family)
VTVDRSIFTRLSLLLTCMVFLANTPSTVVAQGGTGTGGGLPPSVNATVTGTNAVNIRKCPKLSCKIIASAKLGESVVVTGDPVDSFTPVRYGRIEGYVYDLFLGRNGVPVPRFIEGAPGCNRIALIFNVGQGFEPSTGILDILERHDVPATMFVMGWWAEKNPELLERMVDQGLEIGSHGEAGIPLTQRSDEDVRQDVRTAASKISAVIGDDLGPAFTPYAAAMDDRVRALVASTGYLPVNWRVTSDDWDYDATAEEIWDKVVPNAYDGAIVEFHFDGPATKTSTQRALPWVIDALRKRGYQFVTISDMMLPCDAAANL